MRHFLQIFSILFIFVASTSFAESTSSKTYKISIIVFQHTPTEKNTSIPVLAPWSTADFVNSIPVDQNILLPSRDSALSNAAYGLLKNSDYKILYNGTWTSSFIYGQPTVFHLHKSLENQTFDALVQVTMKYYFDVHFQSQWLIPQSAHHLDFYNIVALDETYQTPSNQIQYIDSPNYGALVEIARIT